MIWNQKHRAWVFALIYVTLSILCEIVLLVVFRLKIPRNNHVIAPIILTLPPAASAFIFGYRWARQLVLAAVLSSVLTLVFTAVAGKLTGISTGLGLPIVVRFLAGCVAGLTANRIRPAEQHPPDDAK